MKINQYLIINSNGEVKLRKNADALRLNEISIKLSVTIPDTIFPKPKQFVAPVSITETGVTNHGVTVKII